MADALLDRIETLPDDATHSVIWLHGLGADGNDFASLRPMLGLGDLAVRWVFPHAPVMPVTINGGMAMRAWYDITSLDFDARREDTDGIRASHAAVAALLEREREAGIPSERIVLAGFSQGGAIALHLGLRHPERLAGILALSTYLVGADTLEAERSAVNQGTPVFQAHGLFDPMVPLARGEAARDRLRALGQEVEWHSYPMQHQVCPEEIDHIAAWLRARLGA